MTDKPDSPAPEEEKVETTEKLDTSERDAEHERKMAEMFGDLDEEEAAETPESIKAERDQLRQQLADAAGKLGNSQQDVLTLTKKLTAEREEAATVLARTRREVDAQKEFALEKFVKELLPVLDTLELGIGAVPKKEREADPKLDKLITGFEKVLEGGQLSTVFNKFGIKEINPKGEEFDPSKHEAITTKNDPDAESDTVAEVVQKGYELKGRVIRPAKVIVNQ